MNPNPNGEVMARVLELLAEVKQMNRDQQKRLLEIEAWKERHEQQGLEWRERHEQQEREWRQRHEKEQREWRERQRGWDLRLAALLQGAAENLVKLGVRVEDLEGRLDRFEEGTP